ncbi:MAG: phenylalanine--tRNA ligase subunit alpha [Candidatus Aenigmatarchaeota archaeon]
MYKLTEEGHDYLKNSLPEKQLLKFVENGKPMAEVIKLPKSHIAIGWAKKSGWIKIEGGIVSLTEEGKKAEKTATEKSLEEISSKGSTDPEELKILISRNLVEEVKEVKQVEKIKKVSFWKKIVGMFSKKKPLSSSVSSGTEIAQLTPEILKSGEWKKKNFRKYDVSAPAPKTYAGKKQPYVQFIEEIREKLIGLGFEEMKGPFVESYFWNCDALFMPQDHAARGIHDVLLLKSPSKGSLPDENLVAKVKATHEGGWVTESSGWGGTWSKDDAAKLIMRSQGTAVSARTMFENKDKPAKYFLIDRSFRYDVIDAKHLTEFEHCEGIVVGENLTFSHLLGFLKEIADTIGAEEVRFKPSYFPFTEPSVEMYIKYPKFGWVEVGGAGLMRPEVLKPLGIEKSQVLAWGLGLGRLAMLKFGIDDIRMLYSDDIDWLRNKSLVK